MGYFFHAVNWGYALKCFFAGFGLAIAALLPFVLTYLWLTCVI